MASVLKGKLVASKVYDSAEKVQLRFELTNGGKKDLFVLKWYTPLEGLNSDCLTITRNEKSKVAYDGPMVKRGNPSAEDYILVRAGAMVSAEVDVGESYAVSVPADYKVELNIPGLEHIPIPEETKTRTATVALAKFAPEKSKVVGGKASFTVTKGGTPLPTRGKVARLSNKPPKTNGTASAMGAVMVAAAILPPTLIGGTLARQKQVKKAIDDSFRLVEKAAATIKDDAKYKEWFGNHTVGRFNKAKSVYTKIHERMTSTSFTYNLTGVGCQSGWFAYTYKDSTTIYLCGAFWAAPQNGTDSKAGTLVHEHSHSDASTDDITYGQTSARALAISDPESAVRNADNFEYFVGG